MEMPALKMLKYFLGLTKIDKIKNDYIRGIFKNKGQTFWKKFR